MARLHSIEHKGKDALTNHLAENSLFLLLEPIITALLAWAIFGEHLSPSNWFAFIVVLVGLYLSNLSEDIDFEDA